MNTRKRSSRIQALEDHQKVEDDAKKARMAEEEGKGREKRQEKREQTRAERALEREERARQKEVRFAIRLSACMEPDYIGWSVTSRRLMQLWKPNGKKRTSSRHLARPLHLQTP